MKFLSCMICALVPVCSTIGAETSTKLSNVGLDKQLVIDDFVIESISNLTRELGVVTKANQGQPIEFTRRTEDGRELPCDAWAAFNSPYYDIERDVFRMWHRLSFADVSRTKNKDSLTDDDIGLGSGYIRGYSESKDGIHFEFKSELKGLTTSGDTNLVVTIDDHETDPNHRYKIGYDCGGGDNSAAIAYSADGIHWTDYNNDKPVTYRASDFTNQVYWDPGVKAYRLITRTDFGGIGGAGPLNHYVNVKLANGKLMAVRGVRSMLNPDIKTDPTNWQIEQHWLLDGYEAISPDRPPIEQLMEDLEYVKQAEKEAARRQIYFMTDWMYEGMHLGLLAVYEYPTDISEGSTEDFHTRHERNVENFYIATCRDGVSWDWHWIYAEKPLVPRGPAGSWDKDMLFPPNHIVTAHDKHWIYYGGTNERHSAFEYDVWLTRSNNVGLAWLRLDGFVGLVAGDKEGEFTTKPFELKGKNLEINLDAANSGWVQVEVLDLNGNPIEKFSGANAMKLNDVDDLRARPKWSSAADLQELIGTPIRLRFSLQNAKVYAFQFTQ